MDTPVLSPCTQCGEPIVMVSGFAHICGKPNLLSLVSPAVAKSVNGYPHYGGGIALLLVCPGDGRHWINTTSSNPRISDWEDSGRQVIGMAPDREIAERVVKSLGDFPHCGEKICKRCQAKK